jgi:hypothetical protein
MGWIRVHYRIDFIVCSATGQEEVGTLSLEPGHRDTGQSLHVGAAASLGGLGRIRKAGSTGERWWW